MNNSWLHEWATASQNRACSGQEKPGGARRIKSQSADAARLPIWFLGKLGSLSSSAEALYLTRFDCHIQHLNQSEFVVFKHIWRREISDSERLTVASSNPVMLAVPQLMYGADSWRATLCRLDLFNPADQPSDRSMCAGNGCQMRDELIRH
ncbi:hypothetical protein JOB18_025920 [Solea senegalensis]|uniref:Uncharacterized protein n=1 Tax=Solea senegalensis TaxID=28829 RepID=A0AAV6RYH8_SOLSE|nr:hypothetical protein JOB18_025920 [Solea senegalensis]